MLLHVVLMSSLRWHGDNPSLFSLRDGIARRDIRISHPGGEKKYPRTHVLLDLLRRVKVTRRAKNALSSDVAMARARMGLSHRALIETTFVSAETPSIKQQTTK